MTAPGSTANIGKPASLKLNKSAAELKAEELYKKTLHGIIYPILGKKITWGKDLTKFGLKLFGRKYAGTFSSDKVPPLKSPAKYAIMNLDNSSMPGSHWIAVARVDSGSRNVRGKIWVYDSFGRNTKLIAPDLVKFHNGKLMQVDDDAEQHILEEDCGARCMAWLFVLDRYGIKFAKLI